MELFYVFLLISHFMTVLELLKTSIPTIRLDKLRFFCMPNTLPISYAEAGTLVISRSLKSNS